MEIQTYNELKFRTGNWNVETRIAKSEKTSSDINCKN